MLEYRQRDHPPCTCNIYLLALIKCQSLFWQKEREITLAKSIFVLLFSLTRLHFGIPGVQYCGVLFLNKIQQIFVSELR